jgi:hypothetical protein
VKTQCAFGTAALRTPLPVRARPPFVGAPLADPIGNGHRAHWEQKREAVVVRVLLTVVLLLSSGNAFAEPVDFLDPEPRWIEVAFEVSPRDKPEQADTVYTPKIRARLETEAESGRAKVTIDRRWVEGILLADQDPVAGSFSDFVWIFDVATGEVVSASLSGVVMKQLDWGLFRSKVETKISVDMATIRAGGFKKPRRWLGQQIFGFCDGERGESCTFVAPSDYDTSNGYVNAVGALSVRFADLTLRTFSPLGEAVFTEVEAGSESHDWAGAPAVSAGPLPLH